MCGAGGGGEGGEGLRGEVWVERRVRGLDGLKDFGLGGRVGVDAVSASWSWYWDWDSD